MKELRIWRGVVAHIVNEDGSPLCGRVVGGSGRKVEGRDAQIICLNCLKKRDEEIADRVIARQVVNLEEPCELSLSTR